MKIETKFNIGDRPFVVVGETVERGTVGRIEVQITDSTGIPDEDIFDNYKPQKSYEERYMLEETGIGCGNIYTLGVHVFETRAQAEEQIRKNRGDQKATVK